MVKLRLIPVGKSIQPSFRIVAIDARTKVNGKYIKILGIHDPIKKKTTINEELAIEFLSTGAQPTETVRSLLSNAGIMTKFHLLKQSKKASKPKKTVVKKAIKKLETPKKVVAAQ